MSDVRLHNELIELRAGLAAAVAALTERDAEIERFRSGIADACAMNDRILEAVNSIAAAASSTTPQTEENRG